MRISTKTNCYLVRNPNENYPWQRYAMAHRDRLLPSVPFKKLTDTTRFITAPTSPAKRQNETQHLNKSSKKSQFCENRVNLTEFGQNQGINEMPKKLKDERNLKGVNKQIPLSRTSRKWTFDRKVLRPIIIKELVILMENQRKNYTQNVSALEQNYYTCAVKKKVMELINGKEDIDAHLTHFIQSVNIFKLWKEISVPLEPHISIELPSLKKDLVTLLFDLDETLVHTEVLPKNCRDSGQEQQCDTTTLGKHRIKVHIRPFAHDVIRRLKSRFEIGLFTAGIESYANAVLKKFDPKDTLFDFKLYRQHCYEMMQQDDLRVKDLRIIKNRDFKRIILIDNNAMSYLFQLSNAVPITSFYADGTDREMLKLESFLTKLAGSKDVRPKLAETFKLGEYGKDETLHELISHIY